MGRSYISVYVIWFQRSFQREEEEFMALKKKQRDSLYMWNYLLLVQVESLFEGLPLKKKIWGSSGAKDNHSYHDKRPPVLQSHPWGII